MGGCGFEGVGGDFYISFNDFQSCNHMMTLSELLGPAKEATRTY